MECERVAACPMFALFSRKATLGVWKSLYCDSNFDDCERLRMFRAGQVAPLNLLPNGRMLNVPSREKPGGGAG